MGGLPIAATLFHVEGEFLAGDEIGRSEAAWEALGVDEGTIVQVGHAPPLESITCVRQRIYGHRLNAAALRSIVEDVVAGRYSDVHLAAFLTATAALPFDEDEAYSLTRSEEHTSELQSLMRISYAVFCLKKKKKHINTHHTKKLTSQTLISRTTQL